MLLLAAQQARVARGRKLAISGDFKKVPTLATSQGAPAELEPRSTGRRRVMKRLYLQKESSCRRKSGFVGLAITFTTVLPQLTTVRPL